MSSVFKAGTMLVGVLVVSGCTSLMQGKQYEFPKAGEPAATLRIKDSPGTNLHLMNLNEQGCYAGFTPLPYVDGYIQAPVAVGKELVVTYRDQYAGKVCQIQFSFTPQKDQTYTLKTGSWSETKTGILPIFTVDQHYCGIAMTRTEGDQETQEPIQRLRIDTGITCHKFVK